MNIIEFKKKYYVTIVHTISDYQIKFTKLIKSDRELEILYSMRNIKIYVDVPSNISINDYIKIMKLNRNLSVSHTADELNDMGLDEVKRLYDINKYDVKYRDCPEDKYLKKYSITVVNQTFKKKYGRYILGSKKTSTINYDNYDDFIKNVIEFKQITDDYTVSLNEVDITYKQYLLFLKINSGSSFNIPKTINDKKTLITYIKDLAEIRKII